MKYVILRCEDLARGTEQTAPLLEGARATHLLQLAQAGAGGLLRGRGRQAALGRLQIHAGLLGRQAQDPTAAPARWYAAALGVACSPDETLWCCDLVTQHEGAVVDPLAGRISTKEGQELIAALNQRLGADTRRWIVGEGPHHIFVTRDPALAPGRAAAPRPPELLRGEAWAAALGRGRSREPLRALLEQSAQVLDAHAVNRVRVDLGENPANLGWLWGPLRGEAAVAHPGTPAARAGTLVSSAFPMRGCAAALGLAWHEAPRTFEERQVRALAVFAVKTLAKQDLLYLHLQVQAAEPVERLVAMERIDHLVIKPLIEALPGLGEWRLLVAVDDRATGGVPWMAAGTGLERRPVVRFSADAFAASPLRFEEPTDAFAWLTHGGGDAALAGAA
jgi:2,3-bisphosphoglycerate-independent phosphoglycerate mutase